MNREQALDSVSNYSFRSFFFEIEIDQTASQRYFSQISPRHIHALPIPFNLFSRAHACYHYSLPSRVEFLLATALSRDLFRCLQLVAESWLKMHRDATAVRPRDLTNRAPNDIWPRLNGNLWHGCLSKRKHGQGGDKERKGKRKKKKEKMKLPQYNVYRSNEDVDDKEFV